MIHQSVGRDNLPHLTYAVVGNAEVGKSAFIRHALDLQSPVSGIVSSKVLSNGSSYHLHLLEIPQEAVILKSDRIVWPTGNEFNASPDIDGVLCLYDVSNRDSLEGLPRLLSALNTLKIATCLVSCKVDVPNCDHEIPPNFQQQVKVHCPSVILDDFSIDSPESAKHCLLRVLKSSLAKTRQPTERSTLEPDAHNNFPPRTSSRTQLASSSRNCSQSRLRLVPSTSREGPLTVVPSPFPGTGDEDDSEELSTDEEEEGLILPSKTALYVNTSNTQPKIRAGQPPTPVSTTSAPKAQLFSPSETGTVAVPATPDSYSGHPINRRGSVQTDDSRIYRTFLNMDEDSIHEDIDQPDSTTDRLHDLALETDDSSEGHTFDELVGRLLAMPTSKSEQKFVPSFLCLYRAFSTPLQLLIAIIEQFGKTKTGNMVVFTKAAELLRYLSVLGTWTTYYPGDFADPKVREMATTFVTTIEKTKNYSAAARQVLNNLSTFLPDEDEEWAFEEGAGSVRSRSNTTSQKSLGSSTKSAKGRYEQVPSEDDSSCDDEGPTPSPRHSATTSSASSLAKTSHISSQTSDNLHNLETAREQARRLRVIPSIPVSKTQWHQFMECSVEDLAVEITRIDWTMYSAIRPRDFVQYVTRSNSQRVKTGQVDFIGMMTKHFNHLALFVSGMILLRDKPKHRAMILAKFMDLAWKVRQMNNYHALGAIVAALNSEEIVRLGQTHELITQERQKQFLRLKILMGHQKSHAAYRMAWENSASERIPFLPRIQEDLTKAATANATFIKNKINWSKFEVMGETIISVQKSQDQPYAFPDRTIKGSEITKLILETKVLEGDEVSSPHSNCHASP